MTEVGIGCFVSSLTFTQAIFFALAVAAISIVVLSMTLAIGWLALAFTGNWKQHSNPRCARKNKHRSSRR